MNLVKPSFEIVTQEDYTLPGIFKFIEKCGRVCYKSEDKITEDSYIKFVNNLIDKDHSRPLEFGTVNLKCSTPDYYRYQLHALNPIWAKTFRGLGDYTVTTNYRALLELFKSLDKDVKELNSFIKHNCSDEVAFIRPTVHFVLSRGCMDEVRTHIALSHLAESTRYCNYTKGKFGGVTFVEPIESNDTIIRHYKQSEADYLHLVNNGVSPQNARYVLPLGVKSELISCGFIEAWENFFYRRNDVAAHPEAKLIAEQLQSIFNNKFSELCNRSM